MKQGIFKNSLHNVKKAPPITPEQFSSIISFLLFFSPPPLSSIAALIIAYTTLVRASNLLARAPNVVSNHTLKFGDVTCCDGTLTLVFRSTKTRFRSAAPTVIRIKTLPGSNCCPITAWTTYAATVRPPPNGPAFLLPSGTYLCPSVLNRVLNVAARATLPSPSAFTLHSLRRGGAQAAEAAGFPLSHIMALGTWKSAAVLGYTTPDVLNISTSALRLLLG